MSLDDDARRALAAALTTGDCAHTLHVTSEFIRGEIKEGRLPAMTFKRASGRTKYRIDAEDFRRYIEQYWPKPCST